MSPLTLHLQAGTKYDKVESVTSFVGEDVSGKFGLMANHERFITTLVFGLARYKIKNSGAWFYIALPGGVLHFVKNEIFISTRQYFIDEDYSKIINILKGDILKEEHKLKNMRQSLHEMEQEMFKRLWDIGRQEV